ncbi:hypothetical protein JG688_00018040 [Phytophthora aleatoria]|uniref:Uncharacterized protein n=1 Tax=Phytophthora aleatoria TaxID=2496075 RepID=A0A8J5IRY9_9STRA|nr:hypothetical protein JG688_00018040 [Phytophthora aleatoria]
MLVTFYSDRTTLGSDITLVEYLDRIFSARHSEIWQNFGIILLWIDHLPAFCITSGASIRQPPEEVTSVAHLSFAGTQARCHCYHSDSLRTRWQSD